MGLGAIKGWSGKAWGRGFGLGLRQLDGHICDSLLAYVPW
jgi:hypothetical protein